MPENKIIVNTGFLMALMIAAIVAFVFKCFLASLKNSSQSPRSLPWADQRNEAFPRARACLRQLYNGLKTLEIGYAQYSQIGRSFVMPGLGFGPIVILPQEHIPWLIAQSDSVLSARIPQGDRIAIKYTMPSIDFRRDMFQIDIRKVLTPNLSKLQPILFEDMRKNIDIGFGVQSDHWREVELFKTMENIMFSSLNRVVVGEPLCSNSGYLGSLSNLIKWLGGGGLLVGQIMPPILKPILGYLAAIPILYYKARAMAYLLPVVKQRMTDAPRNELDIFGGSKEPLCLLDYMADDAVESKGNRDLTPEDVATNILFLGLAGVFPTILTATNNFLDILTSDSNQEVYKKIREEATAVFKSGEDWNDHNVLGRLTLADSAIKETLRRSPLLFRGIVREVTQKRGIDLPDGHHLAQGTWLGVAINGVHHDERFYENPNKYDAFRFARGQGIGDISDANGLAASSATAKTQGFTTTSDTYLPWGYGRHACPGRWFVSQQLKLLLAYTVLNYDIQPLEGERPKNQTLGDSMVPPQSTVIRVRRR